MDGWKKYEGKKVYIQLVSKREYSGSVIRYNATSNTDGFLTIKDRYNREVGFRVSEIKLIEVQDDNI